MSVNVELIGVAEVREYLNGMPKELYTQAKKAFGATAADVHAKVSARVRDGSGNTLHSRTGQLRRSLKFEVHGSNLSELGSSVFSEKSIAPYALTHEKGATGAYAIKAKNAYKNVPGGPYLNIPTSFNKSPAGVMRLPPREVFNQGGFIAMAKSGRYHVFLDGIPMFTLVKSVEIPARLKMVETGKDEIPTLLSRLSKATTEAIQ